MIEVTLRKFYVAKPILEEMIKHKFININVSLKLLSLVEIINKHAFKLEDAKKKLINDAPKVMVKKDDKEEEQISPDHLPEIAAKIEPLLDKKIRVNADKFELHDFKIYSSKVVDEITIEDKKEECNIDFSVEQLMVLDWLINLPLFEEMEDENEAEA